MNALLVGSPESISETKLVNSVPNWFVSYQNSNPMLGLFQDSVIGSFEMTRSKVDKIHKFHAMDMVSRCNTDRPMKFDKEWYHSREVVSKILPSINYTGKANFYVQEFIPYIKYRDDEINVVVENGNLLQGVLDKSSIGDSANGGLFHTIYNQIGSHEALKTIYNMQQLFNRFITNYKGITFGLKDVYLSKKGRERIGEEIAKIVAASEDVTNKLNNGQLVPPLEMSVKDFYEESQTAALEHGDEFIKPIMEEIDTEENWLYKIVFCGSKGKRNNLLDIYAAKGSIGLKGSRVPQQLDGRTSINFQRGDTNPLARGYNPDSFSRGINAATYPFSAMEARYELIEIALSTALGGTMSRNAVKNLESIQVSNLRGSAKHNRVVQLLFGENGFDPRKVFTVEFPTIKLAKKDFESTYRTPLTKIAKIWQNKTVQASLDVEFATLEADRQNFRNINLKMESHMRRNFIMKDSLKMPVNPLLELKNIVTLSKVQGYKPQALDPIEAIQEINKFIDDLGYVYINSIQRARRSKIPEFIQNATVWLKILCRSTLNTSILIAHGCDNKMLKILMTNITAKLMESFMDYGINVGILAAECISEPITQFLIDSKHRSGLKKEKTNMIVRFDEILKNKATVDMDNPQMLLIPKAEYIEDKNKVMEIANHIEMLPFRKFITNTQIFLEEFMKPTHPDYQNDLKWMKKFQTLTLGDTVPKDLINWCIRYEISQDDMILKSLKIRTIISKIVEKYPLVYPIYTPQSTDSLVIRLYIRNSMFKKGVDISESAIRDLNDELKALIIRGTPGIKNATVTTVAYTEVNPETQSLEVKKMFAIETNGTNLSKILENPYLNAYECNTTSIQEMEACYGIECARNKIIDELYTVEKASANIEFVTLYADEMSYMSKISSLQRSGLGSRELNQVFLRASFGSPIQVLQSAAINSQVDEINSSMSAPMCMGTISKFGTVYNSLFMDYVMIAELEKKRNLIISIY